MSENKQDLNDSINNTQTENDVIVAKSNNENDMIAENFEENVESNQINEILNNESDSSEPESIEDANTAPIFIPNNKDKVEIFRRLNKNLIAHIKFLAPELLSWPKDHIQSLFFNLTEPVKNILSSDNPAMFTREALLHNLMIYSTLQAASPNNFSDFPISHAFANDLEELLKKNDRLQNADPILTKVPAEELQNALYSRIKFLRLSCLILNDLRIELNDFHPNKNEDWAHQAYAHFLLFNDYHNCKIMGKEFEVIGGNEKFEMKMAIMNTLWFKLLELNINDKKNEFIQLFSSFKQTWETNVQEPLLTTNMDLNTLYI